jgi:hypothetical protein
VTRRLLVGLLLGLSAMLAAEAVPAAAQDALICRKRDDMGGRSGQTHRLGRGNDYFNAGPGPDVIYGGPGNDVINGGRGDDIVHGGPGNDIVCGGVGRDRVSGDGGRDEGYGEEGDDRVAGGPGRDYLAGQAGKDHLIGYGRNRHGFVADGRDFLEGSYRPDRLDLGGRDAAYGGMDEDRLRTKTPAIGVKRMDGGDDADVIVGSDADDLIAGGEGRNVIRAGDGDDVVSGGNHVDLVHGGDGDDVLRGIRGHDVLYGMDGDDDFCTGNYRATFDASCERTAVVDSHNSDDPPSEPAGPFEGAAPLTSISGSCTVTGNGAWEAPAFTAEGEILVRYSTRIKHSAFGVDYFLYSRAQGRDTIWYAIDPPTLDSTLHGYIDCADPGGWELAFYEPPTVPVTFPGAMMNNDVPSELIFRVPSAGEYVADVQLEAGSITLGAPGAPTTPVKRSGSFSLGALQPGQVQHLLVSPPKERIQARWHITIRPAS